METPTIIHFGAVLFLSAALNAPGRGIAGAAILWAVPGLVGMVYVTIVARRMRVQTPYCPQFEDWLFHVLLPFAAYANARRIGPAPLARILAQAL